MDGKFKLFSILLLSLGLTFGILATAHSQDSHLTVSFGTDFEHIDPLAPPSNKNQEVLLIFYDTLLDWNSNLGAKADLLTSWQWIEDGLGLKWKLRKGVKFHNGTEMKASDVKASINYIQENPSFNQSRANRIENVEIVDDYSGIFHLKNKWPQLITYGLQRIPVAPEESLGSIRTKPVGTGPFVFQEWVKGEKIVATKNSNYWKEGQPKVDKITIRLLTQYESALSAFRTGEVDYMTVLKPADITTVNKWKGASATVHKLLGTFYLGFNVRKPPFSNRKVRKAIQLVLNKEQMNEASMAGNSRTADIQIPPYMKFYPEGLGYERNVERAKELLDEAGYPNGFEAEVFAIPNTPREGPIGQVVAMQLNKFLGISFEQKSLLPVANFVDRVFSKQNFDAMICGYSSPPDPDYFHRSYLKSDGELNVFGYNNERMDHWLEVGAESSNESRRAQAYRHVSELIIEDAPIISIVSSIRATASYDYVKGISLLPPIRYTWETAHIVK